MDIHSPVRTDVICHCAAGRTAAKNAEGATRDEANPERGLMMLVCCIFTELAFL